jgi:hypothetical protein
MLSGSVTTKLRKVAGVRIDRQRHDEYGVARRATKRKRRS